MFIEEQKQKILEIVGNHLENYPSDAPEFLSVISGSLKNYASAVEKQRNSVATNALANLIGALEKKDNGKFWKFEDSAKIAYLVDALYYLFPEGKITNHAQREIKIFEQFRAWCKATNIIGSTWLIDVKPPAYYQWMQAVISD